MPYILALHNMKRLMDAWMLPKPTNSERSYDRYDDEVHYVNFILLEFVTLYIFIVGLSGL